MDGTYFLKTFLVENLFRRASFSSIPFDQDSDMLLDTTRIDHDSEHPHSHPHPSNS